MTKTKSQLTVREACRRRMPLDGTDAQALEHALTITEQERDKAIQERDEARAEEKMAKNWLKEICEGLNVPLLVMAHDTSGITRNFLHALQEVTAHDQGYLLRALERERNKAREELDYTRRELTECQQKLIKITHEHDEAQTKIEQDEITNNDQIKRWVVDALQGHVIPWKTGPLVFHDDHVVAVARLTQERDEAQRNYQWMVEHSADERLDGYRELGARAAAAEAERDEALDEVKRLRGELCKGCHLLPTDEESK